MTPAIRRAALRAAAKTAVLAGMTGCWGSSTPAESTPKAEPKLGSAAPSNEVSCETHLKSLARGHKEQLADDDPLKGAAAVYDVFLDRTARESKQTQDCCKASFAGETSTGGETRFACCSALGNQLPEGAQQSACTPWGPPVPPEMRVIA